jgi:hypothetical protein
MARGRRRFPGAALAAMLLAGCGGDTRGGPVRTPLQASEIAQRTLRSAGLDEQIIDVRREGQSWVVTTRWPQTSVAGHLVTVDAADGHVRVERYRSVQFSPPPPGSS